LLVGSSSSSSLTATDTKPHPSRDGVASTSSTSASISKEPNQKLFSKAKLQVSVFSLWIISCSSHLIARIRRDDLSLSLSFLKVGKIIVAENHPQSHKLILCKVQIDTLSPCPTSLTVCAGIKKYEQSGLTFATSSFHIT
jgi:tRNA-binding EMAP/Myf-like protein